MAARPAPQETWVSLDEAMVSGNDAYAATCPSLDWLAQGGSEPHARRALEGATDAILASHGHTLIPEGTSTEKLIASVKILRAVDASVVAVAPEALEVPRDSGAGDAAGQQLQVGPEDVLIPVCESGLGMSQILHVVLSDVARETNWRLASVCQENAWAVSGGKLARVGLPHGAVQGFDSPGSIALDHGADYAAPAAPAAPADTPTALFDALTMHGLDFPPICDTYDGARIRAYVGAAKTMDREALRAEARLAEYVSESAFESLANCFPTVFGRDAMPRAGQRLANDLGISSLLEGHAKLMEQAAAAGRPLSDTRMAEVVAVRRAARESMSATLYAAPFLKRCCHHEYGASKYGRTVFFVVGRAGGAVVDRLVEVATRLQTVRREWGKLGRVSVVLLPLQALERQLADSCRAADSALAQLRALQARSASRSAINDAVETCTVQEFSLQVLMAEAYRSLARVIRAYVPPEWML